MKKEKNNKIALSNAKNEFHHEINSFKLILARMTTNSTDTLISKTIQELYILSNYYSQSINASKKNRRHAI